MYQREIAAVMLIILKKLTFIGLLQPFLDHCTIDQLAFIFKICEHLPCGDCMLLEYFDHNHSIHMVFLEPHTLSIANSDFLCQTQ